jgi:predicted dehydrogenase
MSTVRIGVLGAARIAPAALIRPARVLDGVQVTAVAARDPNRAMAFAAKHGIATVHDSYDALLADPAIDAIYNPLPNGLHGRWTIAALRADKHVLCEKPFTANADEAESVAAVAHATDRVVMEAFHYRYHGLTTRMLDILASGELGDVRHLDTWLCFPLPVADIRWQLDLAGGALMDAGCYAIHLLRTLAGAEPTVRSAQAKLKSPGVDRYLRAELDFADGRTATITASMLSARLLGLGARVTGSAGSLKVFNPIMPQAYHHLSITTAVGKRRERVPRQPSSYLAQLIAFRDAVLHGTLFPTHVDDAVANMRVIDACYRAAGLAPRQSAPNNGV